MRQSYLKNAALLTGSDVVLRLAGMGLRIWLANELGGEGMGLYQLVLAVYSLFITLATAGVSVAATRLMAEELSGPDPARGAARGMLRRLLAAGLLLGLFAAVLQLATADLAARWWLGDVRAAGALRVSALGMPWMAVSAVLRGFFIARRHVAPNVFSQLTEQTVRIALVALALTRTEGAAVGVRCMLVLGATAVSEAVSALCMLAFYRRDARSAFAGQKAVRQTLPAVCGRSCGRWRAGGRWQAPCTPQRTCWCPPALRYIWRTQAGAAQHWSSTGCSRAWLCRCSPFPLGCWEAFRCC